MTISDSTKDLNTSLDEMQSKTNALNDSLKLLSKEGMSQLSQVLGTGSSRSSGYRRPADTIVNNELSKMLQGQLFAGLSDIFGAAPAKRNGKNVFDSVGAGWTGSGDSMQVIIHNNTPAAVTAQQSMNSFDQKQLEITIDQMVASSLVRGQQTSGVMRTLFGLSPSLIGR